MAKEFEGAHVVFHKLLKAGNCSSVQAILLCKRTQDAPKHPGYWGLIGGTVEDDDKSSEERARIEVKEELETIGINQDELVFEKVDKVLINGENGKGKVEYFSSSLDIGMDKLGLRMNNDDNKVEGEGLGWFTAEEIHHLMMRPEDRIAIAKFFEKNGV